MAKPLRISPSSYKTFVRCMRKWWFLKVAGYEEGAKDHFALGSSVHALAERFIEYGILPKVDTLAHIKAEVRDWDTYSKGAEALAVDALRVIETGLHLLYEARESYLRGEALVEQRVQGKCGPLPYLGFVDFACEPDPETGKPAIWDHKTSSNPQGRYAYQTPEALSKDPQLLFYAYALFAGEIPDEVTVRHTYFPTKSGTARYILATVTRADIEKNWQKFVDVAAQMLDVSKIQRPEEVLGNRSACSDYGGCPFAAECPALQPYHLTPPNAEPPMKRSKFQAILAKRNKAKNPDPEPAAEEPKAETSPAAEENDEAHVAAVQAAAGATGKKGAMRFLQDQWFRCGGDVPADLVPAAIQKYSVDAQWLAAWFEDWISQQGEPPAGVAPYDQKPFDPSEDFDAVQKAKLAEAQAAVKAKALDILKPTATNARTATLDRFLDLLDEAGEDVAIDSKDFMNLCREAHMKLKGSKKQVATILKQLEATAPTRLFDGKVLAVRTGVEEEAEAASRQASDAAEELKETLAADTNKAIEQAATVLAAAAPADGEDTKPLAERTWPQPGDVIYDAGLGVGPSVAGFDSIVLLGCTARGALPLATWLSTSGALAHFEAVAKADRELAQGKPYWAQPYGKGVAVICEYILDVEKLPRLLAVPIGHPLNKFLIEILEEKGALVVRGVVA